MRTSRSGLVVAGLLVSVPAFGGWPPAAPAYQAGFPVAFAGGTANAWESSPAVSQLDGSGPLEVVVGTLDGRVLAYHGDGSHYWTFDTGDMGISSKAAIGDVDGDGLPEVVVTAGSTLTPTGSGSLRVLSHDGQLQCTFTPDDMNGDTRPDGIYSSPALADLDGNDGGRLEIVFGGWDFHVRALHHDCSPFWSRFVTDTVWSSPAIGDVDGDGDLEIAIGSDTNRIDFNGGSMHLFDRLGNELPGFPVDIDEVIWSSPALADLDEDGDLDIVVGIGNCWDVPACAPEPPHAVAERIYAWDHTGQALPGWPKETPGEYAFASPAVADLDGDGDPEVVVNTIAEQEGQEGWVYAFHGDGTTVAGWPKQPQIPLTCDTNRTVDTGASPVVADLDGDGSPEVLLVSNWEIVAWTADGVQLSRDGACPEPPGDWVIDTAHSLSASPAVADLDGDGDVEVVIGGADSGGSPGALYAWDFTADPTIARQAWPEARQDRFNRGAFLGLLFSDGFESGDTAAWSSP